jgi:hypothetical protein
MNFSQYGNEVILEAEELRAIIRGEIGFRKCPDCQGEGEIWTFQYVLADDPDQNNYQFKDVSAQFASDFDEDNLPPEYSYAECFLDDCEICHTVCYVPVEHL